MVGKTVGPVFFAFQGMVIRAYDVDIFTGFFVAEILALQLFDFLV